MIYLDNAATTHTKPAAVRHAMLSYLEAYASNSGRAGHKLSVYTGEKIFECRELLASLFNIDNPANIAFTNNTTAALNIAIHGLLTADCHAVIGGMEHNSVLRPVIASGADFSVATASDSGYVSAESVRQAIRENTKLIIINHASNVVGTINPITEIGKVAAEKNIPLLVDAAQTAGIVDIDVVRDNISLLAFAGHKLLYGPTGTGGLFVRDGLRLTPIIQGGTGSMSESYYMPDFMPDMLESGTLNTVGIIGLGQGVKYVLNNGVNALYAYESELIHLLRGELSQLKNVRLYGNGNGSVGVVGFNVEGHDCVQVCNRLDEEFNIAARGGLHCAVLAHTSLGTDKTGLIRLSVSSFTVKEHIYAAVRAIKSF